MYDLGRAQHAYTFYPTQRGILNSGPSPPEMAHLKCSFISCQLCMVYENGQASPKQDFPPALRQVCRHPWQPRASTPGPACSWKEAELRDTGSKHCLTPMSSLSLLLWGGGRQVTPKTSTFTKPNLKPQTASHTCTLPCTPPFAHTTITKSGQTPD